jgi:hypothetical protein
MIQRFIGGERTHDGTEVTGERLLAEILHNWTAWRCEEEATPLEARRILELLPRALKERYAHTFPIPKRTRYLASVQVVKALTHANVHVRRAAINCLIAMYSRTLLYDPDAPPDERLAKQRAWEEWIEFCSRERKKRKKRKR